MTATSHNSSQIDENPWDPSRFVHPPPDDLICSICTSVLDEPVATSCQHCFCKRCIDRWLAIKRSCPQCQQRIKDQPKPVLPAFSNLISGLLVKCDNYSLGCQQKISMEVCKTGKHLRSHCQYETVTCNNDMCDFTALRRDIREHERNCRKRECEYNLLKEVATLEDKVKDLSTQLSKANAKLDELKKAQELQHCYSSSSPNRLESVADAGHGGHGMQQQGDFSEGRLPLPSHISTKQLPVPSKIASALTGTQCQVQIDGPFPGSTCARSSITVTGGEEDIAVITFLVSNLHCDV